MEEIHKTIAEKDAYIEFLIHKLNDIRDSNRPVIYNPVTHDTYKKYKDIPRETHPTDEKYLKLVEPYLLRAFDDIRHEQEEEDLKPKGDKVNYEMLKTQFDYYENESKQPYFMICAMLSDEFNISYKETINVVEYHQYITDWNECNKKRIKK
jgi:hypothetical protein